MLQQKLLYLLADGYDRVERGRGVLEDERDFAPPDAAEVVVVHAQQVAPRETDAPAHDAPRIRHEAQHGQRRDRLPGAALAHDAQHGVLFERQRNAVDGFDHALPRGEVCVEVGYFEKGGQFSGFRGVGWTGFRICKGLADDAAASVRRGLQVADGRMRGYRSVQRHRSEASGAEFGY